MPFQTLNPTTGKPIQSYTEMTNDDVNSLLNKVKKAQLSWKTQALSHRSEKIRLVASLLEKNKEVYATLISTEMGKPMAAARAEIEKCQWVCAYYADNADSFLSPTLIETDYQKSYVCYQPLGVLFAIMPWNFPFWQVFRSAIPNLMLGNGYVLHHAANVTGCALVLEKLFKEADLTDNIFRAVIVTHETAKEIIEHPDIAAVTLTGSDKAGRAIGALAAGALKKVVLELGGSDPYIILKDADLELAATRIIKSRMNNSGQVCIAAKRVIAVKEIYESLQQLLIQKIKECEPSLGPLARADLRETVHKQVMESVEKGAILIYGGKIPDGDGFFYPPTLLDQIKSGMPAFDDEIFGPVIAMLSADNEVEAIGLANNTRFGLSAAIFTRDLTRGEWIAREQIEAGTCCVNDLVSSDPRLPFGGIKSSGYGRELGIEGIREFANVKTICVAK